MTENGTPSRSNGRRSDDPTGLMRFSLARKLLAYLLAGAATLSAYFWNESRQALRDIEASKADRAAIWSEVRQVKAKIESNQEISVQQRIELREDMIRIENKVERLDERLSKWFDRASK